jgi:hypothetical protein
MPLPSKNAHATGLSGLNPRPFRYTTNISVLAALLNHGKEKKLPATVLRNISNTGAGILSRVTLPIGETILLHFYLPESGQPFRAICHVIWSDSQGHCGVRFQDVSEQHLRRLHSWLAGKAAESEERSRSLAMPLGAAISEFEQ